MSDVIDRSGAGEGLAVTLARSWLRVIATPRTFFREHVIPGDQAPGLLFAMGVVLVAETTRIAFGDAAAAPLGSRSTLLRALWIVAAVLFVTPAALHLIAAFQTALLIPLARDRAGVSETVQLLAYAGAPCALAGVPNPEIRAIAGLYATALLTIGISEVHRLRPGRSLLAAAIPAFLTYGLGFRAFDAITTLLARWYII